MNPESRAATCHNNSLSELELLEDKLSALLELACKPVVTTRCPGEVSTELAALSAGAVDLLESWRATLPDLLKKISEQKRRLVASILRASQLAQTAEEGIRLSAEHRRWSALQANGSKSAPQFEYFRKLLQSTGLSGQGDLYSLMSAFIDEESLRILKDLSLNEYWLCNLIRQAALAREKSGNMSLPLDRNALEAAREELSHLCLSNQAIPKLAQHHSPEVLSSWTARLALALDLKRGYDAEDFSSWSPGQIAAALESGFLLATGDASHPGVIVNPLFAAR